MGPDAVFHSRARWYEGPRKKTVMKEIEKRCGEGFFMEVDGEKAMVYIEDVKKPISFKTIQNRLTNIKKNYR